MCIGGTVGTNGPVGGTKTASGAVEAFNVRTGSVTLISAVGLSQPRENHAAAVLGTLVIFAGGMYHLF